MELEDPQVRLVLNLESKNKKDIQLQGKPLPVMCGLWVLTALRVLPWHLDGGLPWHLDGVLPWHLDEVLPWHLDVVLPGHLDAGLPTLTV